MKKVLYGFMLIIIFIAISVAILMFLETTPPLEIVKNNVTLHALVACGPQGALIKYKECPTPKKYRVFYGTTDLSTSLDPEYDLAVEKQDINLCKKAYSEAHCVAKIANLQQDVKLCDALGEKKEECAQVYNSFNRKAERVPDWRLVSSFYLTDEDIRSLETKGILPQSYTDAEWMREVNEYVDKYNKVIATMREEGCKGIVFEELCTAHIAQLKEDRAICDKSEDSKRKKCYAIFDNIHFAKNRGVIELPLP